ncbi:hypothetical protein [Actinomyces howellii]|nr:hypothetical protein [Actinomyces howellii]
MKLTPGSGSAGTSGCSKESSALGAPDRGWLRSRTMDRERRPWNSVARKYGGTSTEAYSSGVSSRCSEVLMSQARFAFPASSTVNTMTSCWV